MSEDDLREISEELVEMIHLGHPIQTADLLGHSIELVIARLAMFYIDAAHE